MVENFIEKLLFACRWLLAPVYLGLSLALIAQPIDFLGIKLSGNSRRDDFSALEAKLGAGKVAQFRAAADQGPDALILLFTASGVVVDQHNRADALAIADAYIRYVEIEAVAHHTGKLGKTDATDKKG